MNREQLDFVEYLVNGTFYTNSVQDSNILIFGSNDYPPHRIRVYKDKVEKLLDDCAKTIIDNLTGD